MRSLSCCAQRPDDSLLVEFSRFCQPTEFRGVSQLCRMKYGPCVKPSKPDEPVTEGEKATFQLTPIA